MGENRKRLLCIGECMVELSPAGDGLFRQAFAGDSYNSAVYLSRQFAPAIEVSYCTALGRDAMSRDMLTHFQSEGINTAPIRLRDGEAPGLYMIQNDDCGERFFQYWRGQSAARNMFTGQSAAALASEFSQFDALYITGISLAILDDSQRTLLFDAIRSIRDQSGTFIAFDPNFRPALWRDRSWAQKILSIMAALSDICLVTLDDDQALMDTASSLEDCSNRWLDWGARELIVKHGSGDCHIFKKTETDVKRWQIAPPYVLSPVDTTGAGDSFAAGYLGARLTGDMPDDAAMLAHRIAAQVIMHPGGVISKDVWQRIERS